MVYRQQVKTGMTQGIDLSGARRQVASAVGEQIKQNEAIHTAYQKSRQTQQNEAIDLASSNMKTAFESMSTDPQEFQKFSAKNKEELTKSFNEPEDKAYFMARYDMLSNPYLAKAEKGFVKEQDKKNINSKRNLMSGFLADAEGGMDLIFTGEPGGEDLNKQLNAYYENRYATDDNGNKIFTEAQIKDIEKLNDNKGYYGVQAVVADKLYVDNKAIYSLRDEMLSDKEGFMKKKNMSSEEFNDSIKYLDTTIKALEPKKDAKETKSEKKAKKLAEAGFDEETALQKRFDILQQGNKFEFSKGVVKNPDLDNLESVVAFRQEIKESGLVLTDAEEKGFLKDTSNAIYRMAQDEYGKDYERKDFWFKKDEVDNVGNTTIPAIDERSEYENENNASIEFRAKVYEDTITKLYENGLSLDNDNQDSINKARQISDSVYTNNMRSRFPTASAYEDKDLLKNSTFQQLMMDEERKVLYPNGLTLPRLRKAVEQPTKGKFTVEVIG